MLSWELHPGINVSRPKLLSFSPTLDNFFSFLKPVTVPSCSRETSWVQLVAGQDSFFPETLEALGWLDLLLIYFWLMSGALLLYINACFYHFCRQSYCFWNVWYGLPSARTRSTVSTEPSRDQHHPKSSPPAWAGWTVWTYPTALDLASW